jgi:hypothetical protein
VIYTKRNYMEYILTLEDFLSEEAFSGELAGRAAGNRIKMAKAGTKVSFDDKTFTSLGKGRWEDQDGEKLTWVELSAMTSAKGSSPVIFD